MTDNNSSEFDKIIGNGSGLINPNSEGFQFLRKSIKDHSSRISEEEKMNFRIKGLKYQMESYLEETNSDESILAGVFLKELVEAIGIAHKDFALYIGYKNSNLSALYSGNRRISYDLALKLGHIFDMNPAIWLNLQNKQELFEIQQQNKDDYKKYQLKDLLKKAG